MEALVSDKLKYFTFWKRDFGNVLVELRKTAELMWTIEDAENLKLKRFEE